MSEFQNILEIGTGFISKNILGLESQYNSKNINIISLSRAKDFPFSDKHISADFSDQAFIRKILKEERITKIFLFKENYFVDLAEKINLWFTKKSKSNRDKIRKIVVEKYNPDNQSAIFTKRFLNG